MSHQNDLFPWDDLQQFIERVENEEQPAGKAKPYIDQIKQIVLNHKSPHSSGVE